MTRQIAKPKCVVTYTNGRDVNAAIIIDREKAQSILGIVSQPATKRIETGQRLVKLLEDLRARGPLQLGQKIGVGLVNPQTGIMHQVELPIEVRDVIFMSKCLLDERQAAFDLMAAQLQRFIAVGDVTTIHAFYEVIDKNQKIVVR